MPEEVFGTLHEKSLMKQQLSDQVFSWKILIKNDFIIDHKNPISYWSKGTYFVELENY